MKGYIYIIKNDLNDKVYIGQTIKTVEERFKQHCLQRTGDHFHRAMRKYGCEHFYAEPLEECDVEKLNVREIYWITKYDSFKNGYNSTMGGDGSLKYNIYNDSNLQQKIIDLYIDKMYSTRAIAKELGCEKTIICDFLRTVGVKLRVQKNFVLNDDEFDELLEMYNTGYSIKALGREYGVDGSTIKRCLIKHGVDLRVKYNILNDEEAIKSMIEEWTTTSIHLKDLTKKYHVSFNVFKRILADNRIDFKKRHYKLSEKECLTVISMFNKGTAVKKIADHFEVDKCTIYAILKRYNVPYLKTV